MARPKRTPFQREADLVTLARLYLQGVMLQTIAQQLHVHPSQITYDLKTIRKRWQEASILDFHEAVNRELERIDGIESENWDSWRASKDVQEISTTEAVSNAKGRTDRARLQKRSRPGDPRYMDGIRWCVEQRIRILGLAPTERSAASVLTGVQVNIGVGQPDERLIAAEAAFVAALYGDAPESGASEPERAAVGVIEGTYRSPNGGAAPV